MTEGFLFAPIPAFGCLRPDGTDDAPYIASAAQLQTNLLWFKVNVPGVGVGYRFGSAVYLNRNFALTAAHGVTDLLKFNPTYQVGTGCNYSNNIGFATACTVIIYPGFDPNNVGETIDLAIIHFAQPIPGRAATITNSMVGQILTHAGFGMYGTPSQGEFPKDGNSRAFFAEEIPVTPGLNFSTNYYSESAFNPYIPGNGKGLSGDSGGGVFDSATNLIGIMEAQIGDAGAVGATLYLNLSQPDIYSWITSNTQIAPSILPTLSFRPDKTIAATGPTNEVFHFEATTDLIHWQEIQVATNTLGTVIFQDESSTNLGSRFYRVQVQ